MTDIEQATLVPLELIDDNPTFARPLDRAHILELAGEFVTEGMHTPPVGRREGGRVQLAYGHHRKAAYQYNTAQGIPGFDSIPVILRPYSDEEMFSVGLSENLERRDLTPMQRARAMLIAKQRGWSSEKIGKKFAEGGVPLTGGAVRNILALTRLPVSIQNMIDTGELTELDGRRLVGLARISPSASERAARAISSGSPVDGEITNALKASPTTIVMWEPLLTSTEQAPLAGVGLWPYSWTPDPSVLPSLEWQDVFRIEQLNGDQKAFRKIMGHLQQNGDADGLLAAGFDETAVEIIDQLMHPSICTKCQWHLTLHGKHWCALKYCHARKAAVWYAEQLDLVSEQTGIAPYVEEDGRFRPLVRNPGRKGKDEIAWDKRSPYLRLRVRPSSYMLPFTQSYLIEVGDVSPETQRMLEVQADGFRLTEDQAARNVLSEEESALLEYQSRLENASYLFLWEYASSVFAPVYSIRSTGLLKFQSDEYQYGHRPPEPEPSLATPDEIRSVYYRRRIMFAVLRKIVEQREPESYMKGPIALSAFLRKVAEEFEVVLPDSWDAFASSFMPPAPLNEPGDPA